MQIVLCQKNAYSLLKKKVVTLHIYANVRISKSYGEGGRTRKSQIGPNPQGFTIPKCGFFKTVERGNLLPKDLAAKCDINASI